MCDAVIMKLVIVIHVGQLHRTKFRVVNVPITIHFVKTPKFTFLLHRCAYNRGVYVVDLNAFCRRICGAHLMM